MIRGLLQRAGLLGPALRLRQRLRARHQRRAVALARGGPVPELLRGRDLALVIPVHNDTEGLARLLDQARDMGCFAQIVVVDDGSDVPVAVPPGVELLRHPAPLGPGPARNAGLDRVRCDHVLFFDSDDRLLPELRPLLSDLAGAGAFDLCLFRHADSRVCAEGRWGQPDWDDRFWERAGHAAAVLCEAAPEALPILAQTANYPWNKILRTGFLRAKGIRFGTTSVHQDIPPHWLALIAAGRVLVSDRICAWHRVDPAGGRLTNRKGAERFQVFEALEPAALAAGAAKDPAWRLALADFALGLVDWVEERVGPALAPRLRGMEAEWLSRHAGPWIGDIAARDPALAARLRGRIAGDAPAPAPEPVPEAAGGSVSFLCIARDSGAAFWDLAGDVAASARPGDQVVVVDDGSTDDTRAWIGRFGAMRGWGESVAVDTVLTATRGQGDTGIAVNLALARARGDHVVILPGRGRLDPAALAEARAAGADLVLAPVAIRDPDDPAPAGSTAPPMLAGMMIRHALLAAPGMRCDEGRAGHGDLALMARLMLRAGVVRQLDRPLVTLPARPAADPCLFAVAADLLRAEPDAAAWFLAALPDWLAGAGQGVVGGLLADAPALAGVLGDAARGSVFDALRAGDRAAVRAALRGLCAPVPLAAPLPGGAPVRLWLEGRHTKRTPFAYADLAALWSDRIVLAGTPAEADLLVCAHPRDLPGMRAESAAVARARPFALVSEEPFWDSLFSPDPLAPRVTLAAGHLGGLRVHQVNHHRSPIYDFDRIPYFLLTEPRYIAAYARLFARNAARAPADWATDSAARPIRTVFMAERRPERFHDLAFPRGDILGLCAWRTRLAEACSAGVVQRLGSSWQGGTPRVQIDDWHGDKIRQLDGQVQILSALENTHQPAYVSEKFFDAFALGAVPIAMASPGHRLHDIGLPEGSWLNLWGLTEEGARDWIDGLVLADWPWEDYARAQASLASLFCDPAIVAAEKARLARAVLAEVARLVDLGPA